MKNAKELAHYTNINMGPMREWYNHEYKYAEKILNTWIKDSRIGSKKDDEIVSDFNAYNLNGNVIINNYSVALLKCEIGHSNCPFYSLDIMTGALDIVFQEMADSLMTHMRNQYPCLRTHYVVMRANKMGECVMYIGPYGHNSETAFRLFGDDGVFMTQGLSACIPLLSSIRFFK